MTPEWFTVKHAAATTSLSVTTIRRAILRGELQASNIGSTKRPTWRISRTDLNEWMERKKGETAVAIPPHSEMSSLVDRHLPGLRGRKA